MRVQVQVPTQALLCRLATLRLDGSPPSAGLAWNIRSGVSSITRPDSAATLRSMRPAPRSNGVAAVIPSSFTMPLRLEVSIIADLTSATVQSGWIARTSAAAPALCGLDMESGCSITSYAAGSEALPGVVVSPA